MHPEFRILLVESSLSEAEAIERALVEAGLQHRLTVLHDGRQALDHLRRLEFPSDLDPDLILLDLNLPGIDGIQLLTEIKNYPHLKTIPVVVLFTSRRDGDVRSTDQSGADASIRKPADFPRYRDLVLTLRAYWQETAPQPPRVEGGPSGDHA